MTEREYDRMQEGFYVTKIEKRIRDLEREVSRLRSSLELIADQKINPWCATIARDALEGKE